MLVRENNASVRVLDLCGEARDAAVSKNSAQIRPFLAFGDLHGKADQS